MKKNRFPFGFVLLCLGWLALMALVVPVDYDWTLYLREHRIRTLARFMGRTIFEGESLGGGDPVVFVILLSVAAYYFAWKQGPRSRFYALRPHLGFFLTSALSCSILMVHSLKWVVGRARPFEVVKGKAPFTDWFVFGPHFITEGTFRGSFPSGHTAQAFVLMGIAYMLAASVPRFRGQRLASCAWGVLGLVYVALMGISRCMSLSHWLSDVLGALGMSWILMHAIYFWMLRIPEQIDYYKQHGRYPEGHRVWELRLCVHLLVMVLGGMAVLLGIRAAMLGSHWTFLLPIPLGLIALGFFQRRFSLLHRRVMEGFL